MIKSSLPQISETKPESALAMDQDHQARRGQALTEASAFDRLQL